MTTQKVETVDGQVIFFDGNDRSIVVHRGSCMLTSVRTSDLLRLQDLFTKFTAQGFRSPLWLLVLAKFRIGQFPTYCHIDWKAHGL